MKLTEYEREILTHSLGISDKNPNGYRTYFHAAFGTEDCSVCELLTEKSLMTRGPKTGSVDGRYFYVTDKGKKVMGVK